GGGHGQIILFDAQTRKVLHRLANTSEEAPKTGWVLTTSAAVFSEDSRRVVCAGGVTGFGLIMVWDTSTGTARQTITGPKWWDSLAVSPDEDLFATASGEFLVLWDAKTGKKLAQLKTFWDLTGLVFSPGGKFLIGSSSGGEVFYWTVEDALKKW